MSTLLTLCLIPEAFVFKIPPQQSSEGHKAALWKEHQIWNGRCRVVSDGKDSFIRLEDASSGKIFAESKVAKGSCEPTIDSSRYFVLRIERGNQHAYIGLGFSERSHAFDFNVALQDHEKQLQNQIEIEESKNKPTVDYSMKEGEKIKVNFTVGTKGHVRSKSNKDGTKKKTGGFLPPPTTSAKNRRRI